MRVFSPGKKHAPCRTRRMTRTTLHHRAYLVRKACSCRSVVFALLWRNQAFDTSEKLVFAHAVKRNVVLGRRIAGFSFALVGSDDRQIGFRLVHFHMLLQRVDEILDRKSTRLNSSHVKISYAVFCLKKKKEYIDKHTANDSSSI